MGPSATRLPRPRRCASSPGRTAAESPPGPVRRQGTGCSGYRPDGRSSSAVRTWKDKWAASRSDSACLPPNIKEEKPLLQGSSSTLVMLSRRTFCTTACSRGMGLRTLCTRRAACRSGRPGSHRLFHPVRAPSDLRSHTRTPSRQSPIRRTGRRKYHNLLLGLLSGPSPPRTGCRSRTPGSGSPSVRLLPAE